MPMKKEQPKANPKEKSVPGLQGIFQGLGEVLQAAVRVAQNDIQATESDQDDPKEQDSIRAVYGVSVRVAPGGRPRVQRFGNIRQRSGEQPSIERFREPMTDLHDEGDHLLVVAELPGLDESAIRWSVSGTKLLLKAQSGSRRYFKRLVLPSQVDEKKTSVNYKNGVLELRLWKKP
jgi:HSP20 family protein